MDDGIVDVIGALGVLGEHVDVDPSRVILAVIVDQRPVCVAVGAVDSGRGRGCAQRGGGSGRWQR